MRSSYLLSLLLIFPFGQAAIAAEGRDVRSAPTGTMQLSATSADLVGEQAASSNDDVLPSDVPIEWQVYVPQDYRSERPAGVLVFVSSINWGGTHQRAAPGREVLSNLDGAAKSRVDGVATGKRVGNRDSIFWIVLVAVASDSMDPFG